jgi:ArsR family transcriptional regulator
MSPCESLEPWEICLFRRHAEFCQVFSNPVRLRLLFLIGDGERAVTGMAEALEVPLPMVSQHLRVMRELGCLQARRDGRTVYYRVSNAKFLQAATLVREGIVELIGAQARELSPEQPAV